METVTISSKFQIVIPRAIRESLGLQPGQKFQAIQYGNRIELVPVKLQIEKGQIYSVIPDVEGEWMVKERNIEHALSVCWTKQEAIVVARDIARISEPSLLVVHKKDGTIQNVHFYGKLPRQILHKLPIHELKIYRELLAELEELDSIRAYEAAKASDDEAIPFEQAVAEIERKC